MEPLNLAQLLAELGTRLTYDQFMEQLPQDWRDAIGPLAPALRGLAVKELGDVVGAIGQGDPQRAVQILNQGMTLEQLAAQKAALANLTEQAAQNAFLKARARRAALNSILLTALKVALVAL